MRLLALALLFPSFSFAAAHMASGNICHDEPDYKQMVECYETSAFSVDHDLNYIYKETLKKASQQSLKAASFLKNNQRNWLKYASDFCDAKAQSSNTNEQGSFYKTAVSSCFQDKSIQRILELNSLTCREGDMASHCLFNE